jgi:hypothetical protein
MVNVDWGFTLRGDDWLEESLNEWAYVIEQSVGAMPTLSSDVINLRKNVVFLKCPAHTDFMKNTFVFKSPIDINLDMEVTDQIAKVWCDNLDQSIVNKIIDMRFLSLTESGSSPYPILGIDFLNVFTCDQPMMITVTPAHLHFNDFTEKASVIPGTYDISKWTRPVECAFEVKSNKVKIAIKKGDALFYIKFNSDTSVKLNRVSMPWDEIDVCAKLRAKEPFKPLKHRYASLSTYKQINNE